MALELAISGLHATGSTNLFDGLFTAYQLAESLRVEGEQTRVILLSDGVATAGLKEAATLRSLADGYAREGIGLTSIGVGTEFDIEVMRGVAEVGAGNFYFLEDPGAVLEVFTEEVKTFMVPIATDVTVTLKMADGYVLGDAYGTNGFTASVTGGVVDIPALFVAGRTDASAPVEEGRRGGGGGILFELLRTPSAVGTHVATVTMTYIDPGSSAERSQAYTVAIPGGEIGFEGWFDNETVEKSFVMLNVYTAFRMAAELAADSDPGAAIGVLETIADSVDDWLAEHPDPDIEDDRKYVDLFIENLQRMATQTPISTPPEPWPRPWFND